MQKTPYTILTLYWLHRVLAARDAVERTSPHETKVVPRPTHAGAGGTTRRRCGTARFLREAASCQESRASYQLTGRVQITAVVQGGPMIDETRTDLQPLLVRVREDLRKARRSDGGLRAPSTCDRCLKLSATGCRSCPGQARIAWRPQRAWTNHR